MIVELSLFALVLVLLNARDRRRDRALTAALAACPCALRSTISVRASLLRRRVVLTLDMAACDHADVWTAVELLAAALPRHVALVVKTRLGPTRTAAISVPAWGAVVS